MEIKDIDLDIEKLYKREDGPLKVMSMAEMSNDLWDFGHSQETLDKVIKEDGFVYKCIADQGSQRNQTMGFDFAVGRNIIEKILKMQPFGHLGGEVIEIYYPESGLAPNEQAAFVWMCTQHPDWHMVKELRIMTRSPWFISDCKSTFVRIIQLENASTAMKDTTYHVPEVRKGFKFIKSSRVDWGLGKPERLYSVYLWGAKNQKIVHYIGEYDNFVYWFDQEDMKLYHTSHTDFWYRLNALWIDDIPLELIKECKSVKEFHDKMKKFIKEREKS